MQRAAKIGGVATLAVGSFLLGRNADDLVFPKLHAATALVASQPEPVSLGVPSVKDVHLPAADTRPSRSAEIMRFGWPGFDNLRTYEDFVLSYDRRTRTAHWVIEHLTPDRMTYDPSVDRKNSNFRPDESIHEYFRSTNEDYFRSGYDRGHLAPAANHRKTQTAIDQTFYLTNMSPQVGKGFNRDKWNELEKHTRRFAYKNPNVYICTGPLYMPRKEEDGNLYVRYKVIGERRVAVPTHFFKVILVEYEIGKYKLEAYVLPNEAIADSVPLTHFLVPLDSIERAAGFLIFDKVPKNQIKFVNGQKQGWF